MSVRFIPLVVLLLVTGCASAPQNRSASGPVPPPGLTAPAVWVDVRVKQMGFMRSKPTTVYFSRISNLNGSKCVPREALYDPQLEAEAALTGAVGGSFASIGSVDGQGGFAAGGDATCMYDETGAPVWEPVVYPSEGVVDGKAFLSDVPPGRYTAVAAMVRHENSSPIFFYFPAEAVDLTEVAVVPGQVAYMGYYEIKAGGRFDPLQQRYREMLSRGEPNRVQRFGAFMAAVLSNDSSLAAWPQHKAGVMVKSDREVTPPADAAATEETAGQQANVDP